MADWNTIRNAYGHFHPALVHFPIALVLTGAALEAWGAFVRRDPRPSRTGNVLLVLGFCGALVASGSGLALFHKDDFRQPVLAAAEVHRVLGLACAASLLVAWACGQWLSRTQAPRPVQVWTYRVLYWLSAILVGLAGHYGGWIVFGWGRVWTG